MAMLRVLVAIVLAAAVVSALPPNLREYLARSRAHQSRNSLSSVNEWPDAQWYNDQTVDHFNGADTRTFRQRYYINDTYFKPATGPVFICVGGEGPPLDGSVLIASVHCNDMVELAPSTGALLVALEHRYYGPSIPVPDFTTENLKYLSAHQALGDLAQFRQFIVQKYNLKPANKWVSFGGSYPGMLAGWFRLNYPHLVSAAVASSAPVIAQVNMQGYNDVVASSLAATSVGGSAQCLAAVTQGHAQVGVLLQTDQGRSKLASSFNLCNRAALNDVNNRIDWAGNGVIMVPSQSNDPACNSPACDIRRICAIMTDTSKGSEIERLIQVASLQNNGQCVYVNHDAAIAQLTNTSIAAGDARIWFYQTCAEFAFYQTCDVGSKCPFTQGLNDIASNTNLCRIAYNIQPDQIQKRVDWSNTFWGAGNPGGRRVMYVNGEVDPWRSLSILQTPGADLPVLNVNGASHHFWTHPTLPTDSNDVVAAREAIWKQVKAWLADSVDTVVEA